MPLTSSTWLQIERSADAGRLKRRVHLAPVAKSDPLYASRCSYS
jgi:hypothetical protein